MENFKGVNYRLAEINWKYVIADTSTKAINYLEIGTFYGANLLSFERTYGAHPESKLYCIDPWEDYEEYHEYKNEQPKIYETFMENIENSGKKDKIIIKRGYSNNEVPKFPDDFFDIIYIDGNHEPHYVMEDAVLSFRKLKKGGIMIFDDYVLVIEEEIKKGIDGFINAYRKKLKVLSFLDGQVFIQKL
jgi:predicted O-methyltransferase YrrM